jgi:hypothetical protein
MGPGGKRVLHRAHCTSDQEKDRGQLGSAVPEESAPRPQAGDPLLLSRLEGLLGRHGVKLVFSGNAHIYQRNSPSFAGAPVTYVTGGAGDRRQPIGGHGCSPLDMYGVGWSYSGNGGLGKGSACGSAPVPTDISQAFHFLLVSIGRSAVTVTPIDELGRRFDAVTYGF